MCACLVACITVGALRAVVPAPKPKGSPLDFSSELHTARAMHAAEMVGSILTPLDLSLCVDRFADNSRFLSHCVGDDSYAGPDAAALLNPSVVAISRDPLLTATECTDLIAEAEAAMATRRTAPVDGIYPSVCSEDIDDLEDAADAWRLLHRVAVERQYDQYVDPATGYDVCNH